MSKLFLIPGLGADCRIYQHIDLHDYEVININWIQPESTDTLTSYAQKLIEQYDITDNSVAVGNSMGGMMAVEIGKAVSLKKIILISSIRTVDEAPGYFSFFRNIPVYRYIPENLINSVDYFLDLFFGTLTKSERVLFRDMLNGWTPEFLKWAIDAILAWDNHEMPLNSVLITGDKDMVFPVKNIEDAIIIKGGTHIMIFDKAPEINKILQKVLSE